MKLTQEQETAIHQHDRNLIVVAGAGSGKTYVLVNRYLALLDANPDWPLNSLIAITFTEKAAQEMRDRVRRELEQRLYAAQGGDRESVWAERLASMDSARISTIHSLCATILRANAAEANIDPGFEVLDEVDARLLLENAIDRTLQAAAPDDPALELFAEFEMRVIRQGLIDLIAAEVVDVPADVFERWQVLWHENAVERTGALLVNPAFHAAAGWIPEGGWPEGDDKLLATWEICWDALVKLYEADDVHQRLEVLKLFDSVIKLNVGKQDVWGGKDGLEESKSRLKILREGARVALKAVGEPPDEIDRRAAQMLPWWVVWIRRTQAEYRRLKADNSLLDFDDLEKLTRDLLNDKDAVRARYQNAEFKHILVDEFQDTNAAQWDIVKALGDLQRPGSLFVVGDPKQSIYQFRGADVSVFDRVRGLILNAAGEGVPLADSFRTHHKLVECFNAVFSRVLVKETGSPVIDFQVEMGEPMRAARHAAPDEAAPLELLLINGSMLDDGDDRSGRTRLWEAYEIARRLRAMVEESRLVYDKGTGQTRPMGYGDVALLFQSTKHITLYEDVFKAQGLPFVTLAGRGYYNRQEVWDLLNLLRAIYNPADNLSLAAALRSPLFNLSDDALLALRLARGVDGERLPLWEALSAPADVPEDEVDFVRFAWACFSDLRERAGRVTISELLREALNRTGYLATLSSLPDGARRRGNVEKLLEKAQTSGKITLGAFTAYLSDLSAREVRESEAMLDVTGVMTLMTVHASKGLEFPVVVLVDSSWERGNLNTDAVIYDAQIGLACKVYDPQQDKLVMSFGYRLAGDLQKQRESAERKRLLYVAATRAQDYLLVSGRTPSRMDSEKEGEANKWKGWLKWLMEALNLEQPSLQAGDSRQAYDWGQVRVMLREQPPPDEALLEEVERGSAWENAAVQAGRPLPGEAVRPALIDAIPLERTAPARHLSATQVMDAGSDELFHRDRFRRSVLQDAPARVEQVTSARPYVSRRVLGEIVHEALRWWRFPAADADMEGMLESYAWDQGIVDAAQRRQAVVEARELLKRTQQSDVYRRVEAARQVFREVPFIFQTEKRIIHGVIDALIEQADGSWAVLDYKTSAVPGYDAAPDRSLIIEHARRYHLQVGVYAAAVREQFREMTGDAVTPEVYIHYIRYWQTIDVPAAAWQAALEKLEARIGDLLITGADG